MNDVMQVASTRKANLESEIAKREAEIVEMREEIESLDEFMDYGKTLMERSTDVTGKAPEAAAPARPMSQPSPKLAETLNALKASNDDDEDEEDDFDADDDEDGEDDAFDTMADDEQLAKSIAQLRPRTRPISHSA